MSAETTPKATLPPEQIRDLLRAGGMASPVGPEEERLEDPGAPPKYNPLRDPAGAERLGTALAERARHVGANVVVVWEHHEDAILAHIVARELSVPAVRTWDADGLVAHSGSLPQHARALILADAFRSPTPLLAIKAFLEQQHGTVAAAAALLGTTATNGSGMQLISLQSSTFDENAGARIP